MKDILRRIVRLESEQAHGGAGAVHGLTPEEHAEAQAAAHEPWEDSFPLLGRDGDYRWFLTRAVPVRDGWGRPVRWFGTNTDVTDQPM